MMPPLAALLAVAVPLVAQGPADSAASLHALRQRLVELERTERELLPASGADRLRRPDELLLARRERIRGEIARALDSLVTAGSGGRAAIRQLAREFPGADPVRRAEIQAAFQADDPAEALALTDRLRTTAPRDSQLVRWRAEACDALGRDAEALRARQALWEMAPDDGDAWRALVDAHVRAGSLPALRESVARIRLLHPESEIVQEQEIEVLHRLGRYEEAARIAASRTGGRR